MIDVRRITEHEELDDILHLIRRLHEMYNVTIPFSAFIGSIATQLKNPFQGIWVGYEEGRPVGFAIATIEMSYYDVQCSLLDTYMEKIDESASAHVWDLIQLWAKESGCKRIVTHTYRDAKAIYTKYGFKPITTYMVKEL